MSCTRMQEPILAVIQPSPTQHESDLAPLVIAARRGDRAAFSRLHARLVGAVHGILFARLGPSDADDAVQEVFLAGWTRLATLRDPAKFAPWLCEIARNHAVTTLRRHKPAAPLETDPPAPARPAPDEVHDQALRILDAIRSLPLPYHEPLVLRLVERMSGPQIAAALDMTHGSVRVNLTRGFALLTQQLARSAPGPLGAQP
ncbi:MAG: sigma-70 family RNA polymerase sigma factor [Planctomycetes bacterium]|nr:sigma-70 family RNA polymerase sigma factor [Planctomycetota bacterium]